MKTGTVVMLVIVLVLAVVGMGSCSWAIGTNNNLVALQQTAQEKLANVGTALQRRADLLPNVAKVVTRYANHEQQTFIQTAQARSAAAGAIKLTPEVLADPAQLAKFQQAQGDISSALSKLMVIQEQYPELKADRMFIDLSAQVEGSENRIKVERDNYNAAVRAYNTTVGQFPGSLVASFRNFQQLPFFQVDEGAKKAPDLGQVL